MRSFFIAVLLSGTAYAEDAGILEDANADHAYIAPTALTAPAGAWSFSDTELLFVGLGYAVTDRFQISATTLLPAFDEMPTIGIASAKARVLEAGNVRGALQMNLVYFRENIDGGEGIDEHESTMIVNAGGVLTYCLDAGCHSHASGYVGALLGAGEEQLVASGSVLMRAADHVKFALELDAGTGAREMTSSLETYLLWYGARFTSRNIGVDLGFARPLCDGCDDDDFQMGYPFVAMTYRSL